MTRIYPWGGSETLQLYTHLVFFFVKCAKHLISIFLFAWFLCSTSFAAEDTQNFFLLHNCYKQWFAGPLFTPNATTIQPGHAAIESVIIIANTYGKYDSSGHLDTVPNLTSIIPYVDFQAGLTDKIAFEIIGLYTKNFCKGATSANLKDTVLRIGYQISTDITHSWIPDFRIVLQETLPTGKYQKLQLKKQGTDCTGQGSYQTGLHLVAQKLFYAETLHPFRLRGDFGYFSRSPVRIHGFNYYGGDLETRGTIRPGQYFTTYLFGEYALSRTWAIACELNYLQGGNGRFDRKNGVEIKVPSFSQMIIYQEVQHTISSNSAVILGGAFTAAGRNTSAFGSLLLAFLHMF